MFKEPTEDDCLIERLARAAEEYKENMLKGLNHMCEDEIQERISQFREFHTPDNPTEQQKAQIEQRTLQFEGLLRLLVENQNSESLIKFGGKTVEDNENNAPRSLNPPGFSYSSAQYQLQSSNSTGLTGQSVQDLVLKKMSNQYEQMSVEQHV